MLVYARYWKPELEGYGGKDYLFETGLPLAVGERVIAPSWKGEQKAIVTKTRVKVSDLPEGLLDKLGTLSRIEKLDSGEDAR